MSLILEMIWFKVQIKFSLLYSTIWNEHRLQVFMSPLSSAVQILLSWVRSRLILLTDPILEWIQMDQRYWILIFLSLIG